MHANSWTTSQLHQATTDVALPLGILLQRLVFQAHANKPVLVMQGVLLTRFMRWSVRCTASDSRMWTSAEEGAAALLLPLEVLPPCLLALPPAAAAAGAALAAAAGAALLAAAAALLAALLLAGPSSPSALGGGSMLSAYCFRSGGLSLSILGSASKST